MKKILFLFLAIWSSYGAQAQSCATPTPANAKVYSSANARGASSGVCINVFFHIVRNTNGTNAFAMPDVNTITRQLNQAFNPHDIFINNAGVGFIDNTNFVNINNDGEARDLGQVNNRADAVNYYIVENLWSGVVGTANSIPSNNLVIRSDAVLTSTSPHEVGHCLNLYHTHETQFGEEKIDGRNCFVAGDLVCDTPADPVLGNGNVNVACDYTGGNGYRPLTNNIMSYSRPVCRNVFTNGQGQRMRNAIAADPLLQPIVNNTCVRISELNLLCNDATTTLTLTNVGTTITTWATSTNVQIVSFTNTSITIRALPVISENGWVTAGLDNGMTLTERFWIGRPSTTNASINVGGTVNQYATYGVSVTGDIGTDRGEWVVPFGWNITSYGSGRSATITPTTNGRHTIHARVINDCGFRYVSASLCVQGSGYFCRDFIDPDDPCANNDSDAPCLPDDPVPFSIFPNPVTSVLTIQPRNIPQSQIASGPVGLKSTTSQDKRITYKLFDSKSSVKSAGSVSSLTNIDVSCFPKGIYILKIYGKTVQTHQILVK